MTAAATEPAALLPILRLAVDLGLVVLVWLVQLVIYPAFADIDRARFGAWHALYTRRISLVVVPLMFAQAGLHMAGVWRTPGPLAMAALGGVLAAWLVTFVLAVPCHGRLQAGGCTPDVLRRLLAANLARAVLWSAVAILSLVAVARSGPVW
jgi:hypothetical protein